MKYVRKMTEKSKTKSRVYLAGKESTVKAVELLQSRLNNRKRSWDNKDNDKSHKMTHRCTSMPLQKKSDYVSLTGFSKSLLMLEVRSHLGKQNWKHMQHLFPYLLDYSNEIEYLIWRYALTILLYSPNSKLSNLQQFLEICVGNHRLNDRKELEKLLLLQSKNFANS